MGALEGVLSTRAAWIGEREVVEVRYLSERLPFTRLLARAIELSCDQRVFATTDAQLTAAAALVGERAQRFELGAPGELRVAQASDQLYYLGRSPLRYLPLTPMQARQVNAALGAEVLGAQRAGTDAAPTASLSPRQCALAERVVRALASAPEALVGLTRPNELSELDEYQSALTSVLERVLAHVPD